jgi:class 3 adenylate cyclase
VRTRGQCADAAGSIAIVSRICFASSTHANEPADDDEDGEHVWERHDEIRHHELILASADAQSIERLADQRREVTEALLVRCVEVTVAALVGQLQESAGDGFLVTFDGPARAVEFSCATVESVRSLDIEARVGVHVGECELVGDGATAIAVHIAARVMAEAHAGDVLVSRTVPDLVAGSGLEFVDRGLHVLKGVPGEWQLYAVAR